MKIVGMIPARYESSRFPGKPLVQINGKTLIKRVWEKARQAINEEDIYVLTDDQRIEEHCSKEGIKTVMTSTSCLTGTDRVYEASRKVTADIYINIQGDEPLIEPRDIKKVVEDQNLGPCYLIKILNQQKIFLWKNLLIILANIWKVIQMKVHHHFVEGKPLKNFLIALYI